MGGFSKSYLESFNIGFTMGGFMSWFQYRLYYGWL